MHSKHVLAIAAVFCSFALCFAQAQTAKTPAKTGTQAVQAPVVKAASDSTKTAAPACAATDTTKSVKAADSTKTVQAKTNVTADTTKAPAAADKNKSAEQQKAAAPVKKETKTGTAAKTPAPADSAKAVK